MNISIPFLIASPALAFRCTIALDKQNLPFYTPFHKNKVLIKKFVSSRRAGEETMQTIGKFIRFLAFLAIVGWGFGNATDLFAQAALGGAALENGCQAYANKAVKYANEWEQLQCQKKLNVAPQLFTTEKNYHYNRCKNSVGTTIAADLQSMENELKPCRGVSGRPVNPPGKPENPPAIMPPRDNPPIETRNTTGDVWDIVVINSSDLGRSEHSYRISTLNGRFTAQNTRSGGPEFSGQANGSVFEAVMTDHSGYWANFVGHLSSPKRIEGTGCDNRGQSFSFSMDRR
jgi:hypothetical protein